MGLNCVFILAAVFASQRLPKAARWLPRRLEDDPKKHKLIQR